MASEKQGCLASILNLFGIDLEKLLQGQSAGEELPYRLRDAFLSAAELSFFHVLVKAAGDQYYVCTKVRISDLLFVVDRRNNMGHANRIDRKHVDFVLCDPKSMQPLLIIELDDSTHERSDRSDRDELIDAAFEVVGLPVLHVPARKAYSPVQLAEQISSRLGSGQTREEPANVLVNEASPSCPKCQIPMVERKAARGRHAGKRFWACPSYPDCREIVAID